AIGGGPRHRGGATAPGVRPYGLNQSPGAEREMKNDNFRSVLIFGGAGFIGSNWALRLLETTDAKVHIFDNLSRPGVRHNLEMLQRAASSPGRLQITVADVRDAAKVERAVRFAT